MKEFESIGSISSIISVLNENFDQATEIWFRGQSRYELALLPSLFRQGDQYGCTFRESEMYEEFIRRHPEQFSTHKSVPEWLALMQHYGVPTRLLDWTTNLLVALYFGCKDDKYHDASLFAFDPKKLSDFEFNKLLEAQILSSDVSTFYSKLIFDMDDLLNKDALLNEIPVEKIRTDIATQASFTHKSVAAKMAFKSVHIKIPSLVVKDYFSGNAISYEHQDITRAFSNIVPIRLPYLDSRVKQQHGCFTLHGGAFYEGKKFIQYLKMEDHSYLANSLIKLKIRAESKINLLRELRLSGIKESLLFPEMEYQAKDIREKHTFLL